MATLAEIREGLAVRLSLIEGVQVSAYMLASPTPPAIHVYPSGIAYDRAMHRGLDEVSMTVQAFLTFGVDVGAQLALDELLAPSGSRSVKAVIEGDRTLGNKVQDTWVRELSGYDIQTIPDRGAVLVATWVVEIRS